jgi:protoporphyrinogen/coproporphyrinogen III oxidase
MAGLAAAHALVKDGCVPGSQVVVVEASERVGGSLRPVTLAGRPVDAGPDAVLTRRPEGVDLISELGLTPRVAAPATGEAYLAWDGRLVRFPRGLVLGVPTIPDSLEQATVLSPSGRDRAREGFVKPSAHSTDDVTVAEMVSRRWGSEVAERLAGPLLAAVHAGRADYLSAELCAPQLFPDARPEPPPPSSGAGAPFLSLEGGLWQLAGELSSALSDAGVDIRTNAPLEVLERAGSGWVGVAGGRETEADRVVLALPANVATRLLVEIAPEVSRRLASVEHASVAMVCALLAPETRLPQGSGFLVPEAAGRGLLTACTFFDQKWPAASHPHGRVVRLSSGRHGDTRFTELEDDALVDRLTGELGALLGATCEPIAFAVTRYAAGFPQYAVGHRSLVERIQADVAEATSSTLALCGNTYAGVGLPAVIGSARLAARRLSGGA